jgi:hypothetical protein
MNRVLASLVIKIEYCRALHRGSKEPSRPGSLSCLTAFEKRPISRFPAAKKPSISSFSSAFLPGTAQYVECDVTHSKQSLDSFLTGATTTHIRAASQRAAASLTGPRVRLGRTKDSVRKSPFLTGSAPQTEFVVTHSKQTLEKILTGARTHIKGPSSDASASDEIRAIRRWERYSTREIRNGDSQRRFAIGGDYGVETVHEVRKDVHLGGKMFSLRLCISADANAR